MKTFSRKGLSMAELMVAVTVIALSLGPLIGLLSNSNQMSNNSIYEEMSVHYCRELTDQFLRLSPKIPIIVETARKISGNKKLQFGDLLNDSGFNLEVLEMKDESGCVPFQILGRKTDFRIFVSKMDKVFTVRKIVATKLDSSANKEFKEGAFWKILVEVSWQATDRDPVKKTQTVVIVGDLT